MSSSSSSSSSSSFRLSIGDRGPAKFSPTVPSRYSDLVTRHHSLSDPVRLELVRVVNEWCSGGDAAFDLSNFLRDLLDDTDDLQCNDSSMEGGPGTTHSHGHINAYRHSGGSDIGRPSSLNLSSSHVKSAQSQYNPAYNKLLMYPHEEMSSASVISLADATGKVLNDAFLKLLMASYRNTNRSTEGSSGHHSAKLRISLIAEDGDGAQTLEFPNEKDYWCLIYAVRKSYCGADVSYSGRCFAQLINKSDSTRLMSLFTNLSKDVVSHTVSVHGSRLRVVDRLGSEIYSCDLHSIRALAVNVDYNQPRPVVLEVRLSPLGVGPDAAHKGSPQEGRSRGMSFAGLVGSAGSSAPSSKTGGLTQHAAGAAALASDYCLSIVGGGADAKDASPTEGRGAVLRLPLSEEDILAGKIAGGGACVAVLAGTDTVAELVEPIPFGAFLVDSRMPHDSPPQRSSRQRALSLSSLRLDEPVLAEVVLKAPGTNRAARIFVKTASDLTCPRGVKPSAYCTVYLVGANGEKLSSNNAGSRTDICPHSSEPTWNRELLLQDHMHGVGSAAAVMVRIRDSSAGVLKHTHLGQVTIPISCFIFQTEADFCLPLEPTERMDAAVASRGLGEIFLCTQLVDVETTEVRAHVADAAAKRSASNKLSIFASSMASSVLRAARGDLPLEAEAEALSTPAQTVLRRVSGPTHAATRGAYLSFTLRRAEALGVWWPARALYAGGSSGHLLCGQAALTIRLLPGTGGVLANCDEMRPAEEGERVVTIPWSQMGYSTRLTDAALMATVTLHHCLSTPSEVARGERRCVLAEVDLLVAPCPADLLQHALLERASLWGVRCQLKSLTVAATPVAPPSTESYSPLKGKRASHFVSVASAQILPIARVVQSILEGVVYDTDIASIIDPFDNLSLMSAVDRRRRKFQRRGRARLYQAHLVQICRDLADEPDFAIAAIQATISADVAAIQEDLPFDDDRPATSLAERFDGLLDKAADRVREYVLCSFKPLSADPAGAARGLEELIGGYYNALRLLLHPYIGSRDSFRRTRGGHDLKLYLVRLVIDNNDSYDNVVRKVLSMQGWAYSHALHLAGQQQLNDVIDWYSQTLVQETRTWLVKTVQNASIFKTNDFDIPWDVEDGADSLARSALPETLQIQLNVYMDLCTKKIAARKQTSGSEEASAEVGFQTFQKGYQERQRESSLSANTAENRLEVRSAESAEVRAERDKELERAANTSRVNERVVGAVGQSYLLLAGEFKRALQSKHWDQGRCESGEVQANLAFLLAVLNDAQRVTDVHVESVCSVDVAGHVADLVVSTTAAAFLPVCETAVKFVNRIVYSEVQSMMLDFDVLWPDTTVNITRRMMAVVARSLADIKERLAEKHFSHLLCLAADTFVLRFVLYLKDRAAAPRGARLSAAEVLRIAEDAELVAATFSELCPAPALKRDKPVVASHTADLALVASLLTADLASALPKVMKGVVARYFGDRLPVAVSLLRLTTGALRPDAHASIAGAAVEEARKDVTLGARVVGSDDVFVRIFEEDFSKHQGDREHRDNEGDSKVAGQTGQTKKASRRGSATLVAIGLATPKKGVAPAVSSNLKILREKASNFMDKATMGDWASRRKNEEYAVSMMRKVGLEDGEADAEGDSVDSSEERMSVISEIQSANGGRGRPARGDAAAEDCDCRIHVAAVKVRGLRSHALIGGANPYVALVLGSARAKTVVAWNASTHDWGPTNISFACHKNRLASLKVGVRVFDKERLRRKRLLGAVSVQLAGVDVRGVHEAWFALEGGASGSNGDVFLRIEFSEEEE